MKSSLGFSLTAPILKCLLCVRLVAAKCLCRLTADEHIMTPHGFYVSNRRCFVRYRPSKNCREDKGRVNIIGRTASLLIITGFFFAACRNGNTLHSFRHVQFDHHLRGILVSLPSAIIQDVARQSVVLAHQMTLKSGERKVLLDGDRLR